MNTQTTNQEPVTEYQELVMEHANLRATSIRLSTIGTPLEEEAVNRTNSLIAMAMEHANTASQIPTPELQKLIRSVRFSIRELTALPKESHGETRTRCRKAAQELRRQINEGE